MNWPELPRADIEAVKDRPIDGLMGEIAYFIYGAAYKQIPEVAIAAAIAYFAGLMGRAYNVSGTGLNQYVVLLANSGIGKDAAISGVTYLNECLREQVPEAANSVSPYFASPQAINRYMAQKSQCFVWFMDEIGIVLQNLCSKYASANDKGIKRALLALYSKSGSRNVMQGSAFADGGKDLQPIPRPALSIFGESIPSNFYKAIDEDNIEDGFVPRITVIQYTGERPPSNKSVVTQPSPEFLSRLANRCCLREADGSDGQCCACRHDA